MVADGGVIEAPAQPYKEKPTDPGGKTFQGTGDTSFAVSEGETRTARLGDTAEAPRPGFEGLAANEVPGAPAAQSVDKTPAAPKSAPSPEPVQPAGPAHFGACGAEEALSMVDADMPTPWQGWGMPGA